MRVLIIEDEKPAAVRLQRLLKKQKPEATLLEPLDSVVEAIKWFRQNETPDLLFLDIQLADGLSFDIFKEVDVNIPVIFCTAYDQYTLKAFDLNSVSYLLKPVSEEELQRALAKFDKLYAHPGTGESLSFDKLAALLQQPGKMYKERFMVKVGDRLIALAVTDICYLTSRSRATFAGIKSGKEYPLDFSLDQTEQLLDPKRFFRISRQYIVALTAIQDIRAYSSSRLKLKIEGSEDQDILVSRERVAAFKQWLDR